MYSVENKKLRFEMTIGALSGYGHDNSGDAWTIKDIIGLWHELMEREREYNNIVVSAAISESYVVYPLEFGCPKAGEIAFTITGVQHHVIKDADAYKACVLNIAQELKSQLNQTTLLVAFSEVDATYFSSRSL